MSKKSNATRRHPGRRQDPRLTAERVTAIGSEPVTGSEVYAVVVSPVELPDGRVLALHGPQVVTFNLFEALEHGRRGAKTRRTLIGNLYKRKDDWWGIRDPRKGLDCVHDLMAAVLFSYTALEGLANHTIDQMDPEATVEVERDGEATTITRDRMVRALSLSEKLSVVIPAHTGAPSIKGQSLWREFVRLRRLRDALVHPKNRGSNPLPLDGAAGGPDPKDPGIYGQLMRGDADTCADDALTLVTTLRPEFLPEHVRASMKLPQVGGPARPT